MKPFILSALFITLTIGFTIHSASGQSFEGIIEFKKQTTMDTINYIYYIKNDKVRLDEISNKTKKVEGSFIINLVTNKLLWLNHERKLFMEQGTGSPVTMTGKAEVKKTGNVKQIQGFKCMEYIVKNTDEKTQVTYWMANGNFNFFFKLLKILNRKDKSALYIQQLTDVDGKFPFLSSQLNLESNQEEVKMEVTKLQKKALDENMFAVPKDYQQFQKQ